MMITRTIALLAILAGIAVLIFTYGHKRGRRSCRNEYPDGWDAGQKSERDWWEHAAGITREALARWQRPERPAAIDEWEAWEQQGDPPSTGVLFAEADERLGKPRVSDVPTVAEIDELAERWRATYEREKDQPLKVLPHDPEWDISEEEFEAAKRDLIERHGAIPLSLQRVIDSGGRFARRDRRSADAMMAAIPDDRYRGAPPVVADITDAARWRPFEDDTPTVTGVVLGSPADRTGPEWLDAQIAAMDSETDAYLRRVEADCRSFRLGIGAYS